MKVIFCLFGVMSLLASVANADGQAKARATIDNLNRAAMNREWAGNAMVEQAESQQAKATAITKELFETAIARRLAFRKAGKLYIAASRSFSSAVSNFDKAASNYGKIVKLYAKSGDADDKATFQAESVKARGKGTAACRQAAIVCAAAAAVYNGDADDLRGAASATQAAAGWWEKLATR